MHKMLKNPSAPEALDKFQLNFTQRILGERKSVQMKDQAFLHALEFQYLVY